MVPEEERENTMRKKELATIIMCGLLLSGCGATQGTSTDASTPSQIETETETINETETQTETETKAETETETVTKTETIIETETETESETITETETETETQTEASQAESTALFKDVYLPYAKREKPFIFDGVKTFAQNTTDYATEINEPGSGTCSIKFSSDSGDYVYFSFLPTTNDVYAISSMSYYQASTNSEVTLSNDSPDCTASYDTFHTHVLGESKEKVSGPDEQQSFLFK